MKYFRFALIFSVFLFIHQLLYGQSRCVNPQVDVPLLTTEFHDDSVIKTLEHIGKISGICFGVDVRNPSLLKRKIDSSNLITLRKFIQFLGPSVAFSIEHNVVMITLGIQEKPDWLDSRIGDFRSISAAAEYTSSQVYSFLEARVHPKSSGSIGSISISNSSGIVQAFEVKNASVRSLLSAILENSTQAGMWFSETNHPSDEPLPTRPFWSIHFYSQAQ